MNKRALFNILLVVAVIEGIVSFFTTTTIPGDASNAFLFGFSKSRFLILLFLLLCLIGFLALFFFEERIQKLFSTRFNSSKSNKIITAIGIFSLFLLWVTIFIPTNNLNELEALFIRLRPTLIWAELLLLQFALWIKISKKTFSLSIGNPLIDLRTLLFTLLPLLLVWVFVSISKVGLVMNTAYWNVPGIPLSMIQFIGILLFLLFGLIFFSNKENSTLPSSKFLAILIPFIIYIAAVLIWGSTPMLKHFFSLQPTPPNFQPYPYSDARAHDLGASSVLMGKGIYFHGYTDKPLYMLFLAVLHVFTGDDYTLLQWAHILVLAFTPVILYLFGKKYFGRLFGIIIAAMLILQQRNAIVLSYKVASVNPKLLMSEELTLLGMVLVTYVLFRWMRVLDTKGVFIIGGLLGAFSLVRINPIFIAPVVGLIILINFRKAPKMLFKQFALFGIGFLMVFSPWLVTGVNPQGTSWFIFKIQDVIQNRYPTQGDVIPNQKGVTPTLWVTPDGISSAPTQITESESTNTENNINSTDIIDKENDDLLWIMVNHFLHNYSTSLLALPDSIKINNLDDLSMREYWQDVNQWDGNLPPGQYLLILVNISLMGAGIVFSWKKYHWAGLAPLIVFLAYDLSLSAALNSGSRYIVPINWVIFWYYTLGLVLLCYRLLSFAGLTLHLELAEIVETEKPSSNATLKSWIPAVAIIVLTAFLLPAANLVVPKFVQTRISYDQLLEKAQSNEPIAHKIIEGVILYPYFKEDGLISFEFLHEYTLSSHQISSEYLTSANPIVLENRTPALLSFVEFEAGIELKSIYVLVNNSPELYWQFK